ncbi:hypothetical protein [Rhodococcus sp. WY5]|uniref:hypothetical protein n=1 Tax=Rhodococcus sp. WY5 TaxID=2708349 RepID=UPI001BDF1426|nr:hypothetical protein [Rhodococcus sp. WY5]
MMRKVKPLSTVQEAAWRARVEGLSAQVGVSCPRVEFVDGGMVTGASYHPFSDRLKIRVKWIAAAGGDPSSRAATALLSHELGHKADRRFVWFSLALVVVCCAGLLSAVWFADGVWPALGAVLATVVVLTPVFHQREFRADDVAADTAGVRGVVEWFRVAPGGSAAGLFHPSDAARVIRQELRSGRPAEWVAFEGDLEDRRVEGRRRVVACWRELCASAWGVVQRPFDRRKRPWSCALILLGVGLVAAYLFTGEWRLLALALGAPVLFGVVGFLVYFVVPGWRLSSADGCASLRVVPRRSVPGVYEVRGYSRWPRTASTGVAADGFVDDLLGAVDTHGVTLVARFAAEGLREKYIRRFLFEDAPLNLCQTLSVGKAHWFLVRPPRKVMGRGVS